MNKRTMKDHFFSFLQGITDINQEIQEFWETYGVKQMKQWYVNQAMQDDVIISASPDFLLFPMAERYGFNLIASLVDSQTGRFMSENCYGEEKVRRFEKCFSVDKIDEFYSDSQSDYPMAKLAKKAFLVDKDKLMDWDAK